MEILVIEEKLSKANLAYQRQLSLVTSQQYDPKLTFNLKKDIEWLQHQKKLLEKASTLPCCNTD